MRVRPCVFICQRLSGKVNVYFVVYCLPVSDKVESRRSFASHVDKSFLFNDSRNTNVSN